MIEVVTTLGAHALAEALTASSRIMFTKCVIGSGEFDPETQDARDMTGLITPVVSVNVSAVREESDGVAIVADVNNTEITGGTQISEIGILATVNNGSEFLFAYGYATTPEIVPPPEEATYERRFITHVAMSDDELELTVTYDTMEEAFIGSQVWRAAVDAALERKANSSDLAAVATSGSASDLTTGTLPADRIPSIDVSKLNGVIDSSHLPSYVDDVIEYASISAFPATGESGKIYVTKDTNKTYRWSGSDYVEISESLALGTTESTAFRGDYGASAYSHAVTNKGAAFASGLYKIATNSEGHVTGAVAVTKADILALGIIPTGGAAGKALIKASAADYDVEWGSVGSQAPSAPTNFTATPSYTSCSLNWDDPPVVSQVGNNLAVWAATVLVRSTTACPSSISDGTIVVSSSTNGEFSQNAYVDTGLNDGTTYYYSLFAISASGTASTAATAIVTTVEIPDPSTVTWANGSWSDIQTILDLHYAGVIDIHDYWHVGDVRTVPLSAMAATGVGESHVAQNVQIVLAEATNAYTISGTNKKAAFIWNQVNFLSNGTSGEYGYMNSSNDNSTGWDGCARRTWCNNVYKAALPSGFQSILKQVDVKTANKGSGASQTKVSSDFIFLAAEPEIFGANTYSSSTYESPTILPQWDYFKTAANRIKKAGASGSAGGWWERSPYSSTATAFCGVYSDGTAGNGAASGTVGLAPCGCI